MSQNRRVAAVSAGLFLLVVLIFSPVRHFEFINFDDPVYVTENAHVRAGLTWEGVKWAFTNEHGAHWHPLSWLSHMLDRELFGLHAGSHHLMNVGIHAFNAVLLLVFLSRLGVFSLGAAVFMALIFALHPLRIESVAWVTERKDVLSMFFMLLVFHSYLSFVRAPRRSWFPYVLSVLSMALALLAKPSAVVLPVLLYLLDFWPLNRLNGQYRSRIVEKLPFVLLAIGCAIAAVLAQGSGGGLKSTQDFPIDARFATVTVGYLIYLGKFFLPTGEGIFYPYQLYQPGMASAATFGLIVISIAVFLGQQTRPYLLFGWLWFLVALAPVIGIIQVGGQSYADRWSYLPHIGLLMAVTAWWFDSQLKRYVIPAAIFPVLAAIVLTVINLPHWRSSETIFRHTLEVVPENFMAEMNLGLALREKGAREEAAQHLKNAVLLRPFYPDALNNLAIVEAESGNRSEAEALFRRAISSGPGYIQAWQNLIRLLLEQRRPGAALEVGVQAYRYGVVPDDLKHQVEQLAGLTCEQFETTWIRSSEFLAAVEDESKPFHLRLALKRLSKCGERE